MFLIRTPLKTERILDPPPSLCDDLVFTFVHLDFISCFVCVVISWGESCQHCPPPPQDPPPPTCWLQLASWCLYWWQRWNQRRPLPAFWGKRKGGGLSASPMISDKVKRSPFQITLMTSDSMKATVCAGFHFMETHQAHPPTFSHRFSCKSRGQVPPII